MYESLPLFPILLPSVPFEERHRLPHKSWIYFALAPDSDVLYIGAIYSLCLVAGMLLLAPWLSP